MTISGDKICFSPQQVTISRLERSFGFFLFFEGSAFPRKASEDGIYSH
jgi:hypothetical protein